MATRSYIGIRNLDASVDYIYCHYDGYPSHNGVILTQHYDTYDKVKKLLELGDLSILGEEVGEQQDFNNRSTYNRKWCLAYGRDRGEENVSVKNGDFDKLISDQSVDYVYVFDGDYWEGFDTYSETSVKLYNMEQQNS